MIELKKIVTLIQKAIINSILWNYGLYVHSNVQGGKMMSLANFILSLTFVTMGHDSVFM
jgi:hypothetical protein